MPWWIVTDSTKQTHIVEAPSNFQALTLVSNSQSVRLAQAKEREIMLGKDKNGNS